MGIQMFFEGLITDKTHATQSAFKFDPFKKLSLSQNRWSKKWDENYTYCVSEVGLSKDGVQKDFS